MTSRCAMPSAELDRVGALNRLICLRMQGHWLPSREASRHSLWGCSCPPILTCGKRILSAHVAIYQREFRA